MGKSNARSLPGMSGPSGSACGRHAKALPTGISWPVILRHYDHSQGIEAAHEFEEFRQESSLKSAVERAARAINTCGKRYRHQCRIARGAIEAAAVRLHEAEGRFRRCRDFDALLQAVNDQVADVPGIGELYTYDTAIRIGAYMGIEPTKVYLHAGTRKGARLLGLSGAMGHALEMRDLPAPLRSRNAREVEDILCIYRHRFAGRLR